MAASTARRYTANNTPAAELLSPLDRLRGIIFRYVLMDVALFALLFLTCWFWLGLALDWGVFKLTGVDLVQDVPVVLRLLVPVFLLGLMLTLMFLRGFFLLRKELTDINLALLLEKRYPKLLGDRLITAIELADVRKAMDHGYSEAMVRQTITEARERIGRVNVRSVFNWTRLWVKLLLVLGVTLLGIGGGLAAFLVGTDPATAGGYAGKLTDASHIWLERNVAFSGTPWPRRAHVELIGFPESNQLRIGKNAAGPVIKARAYKWVVAAPGTRDGWRPLKWGDLNGPEIRGTVLACPLPKFDTLVSLNPGFVPTAPAADVTLDEIEFALGAGADADFEEAVAAGKTADDILAQTESPVVGTASDMRNVFLRLNALSRQSALSRTFRKLLVPRTVMAADENGDVKPVEQTLTLEYVGAKTSAPVTLSREPSGVCSGQVTGLKETVTFDITFEDFTTERREIFLVPPPMITDLQTTDYHPAYLYHKAPSDQPLALRGLKQVFRDNRLTLTGTVTDHKVPFGSEIDFTATADKVLRSVRLVPKTPNLRPQSADADVKSAAFAAGDLALETRKVTEDRGEGEKEYESSVVTFSLKKRTHVETIGGTPVTVVDLDESITQPTEFELEITDRDGVTDARPIKIRTTEDTPPEVKLEVDELFVVGSEYWFTPLARIPFKNSSSVTDASGLGRVVFDFRWSPVESSAVSAGLADLSGPSVASTSPAAVGPSAAPSAVAAAAAALMVSVEAGGNKLEQRGTAPVPRFNREFEAVPADTLAALKAKLARPFDGNYGVVRSVKFTEPGFDVFDVEASLPNLRAKADEIQQRYQLKLNVTAADTNVDRTVPYTDWHLRRLAGNTTVPQRRLEVPAPPKTAEELKAVPVLIVSEGELVVEISKKEDALISKIDEAVKRVEDAQRKLLEQAGFLANPAVTPDALKNAAVRAGDVILDVGKARSICDDLLRQYSNIATILKVNRCNEALLKSYENPPPVGADPSARGTGYVDKLAYLLKVEPKGPFQTAGEALDAFQAPLAAAEPARPADEVTTAARVQIEIILRALKDLQDSAGKNQNIVEQIKLAERILAEQRKISSSIAKQIDEYRRSKQFPAIAPPEQVTLKAGEKRTLKLKIDWQLYKLTEIYYQLEKTPADGDVTVPKELTLKEEKNPTDFEIEVTAGTKPGITVVKLKGPAGSRAVDLRIEVTK